jgi:hypothetical protein
LLVDQVFGLENTLHQGVTPYSFLEQDVVVGANPNELATQLLKTS